MRTEKLTSLSILCAVALVLGFMESMIPAFAVIPGGKLGLANIVTMVVFCMFSFPETMLFGLLRSLLSAVLYSGFSAFFYSIAGTVFSVLSMFLLKKMLKERVSEVGLSVTGAVFFNVGQLTVASLVLGTIQIFRYFPVMGILSAFAGVITGYIAGGLIGYVNRKKSKNNVES